MMILRMASAKRWRHWADGEGSDSAPEDLLTETPTSYGLRLVKKTRCGPFPLPAPYRRSVPVTTISLSLLPHFEQTSRSSHSSTGVSAS